MKDELKKQVKDLMIQDIQSVINGEKENVSLLYTRPNDIIKYIKSLGGSSQDDFDTNGWQWDYWFNITLDGNKYSVSGDGYYSDSASFSIYEE